MNKDYLNVSGNPFDPAALKAELARRGMNLKEASEAIGRAHNFLASACNAKRISKPTIIAIESLFNISPESYLIIPEQLREQEAPVRVSPFSEDQFIEELKRTRGGIVQLQGAIEDLHYTLRTIAADVAELKEAWTEEEGGEE